MTLFEVLSMDERVIVYSDVGNNVIYTWNRSITLQAWINNKDNWEVCDVTTLSEKPYTYERARVAAIGWSTS